MVVTAKKKSGSWNEYTLTIKDATAGKILSIQNALQFYVQKIGSEVGREALEELNAGIKKCEELREALK